MIGGACKVRARLSPRAGISHHVVRDHHRRKPAETCPGSRSRISLWAPWRLEGKDLIDGKRDATLLAVKMQEDAGIDIVGDGEQARQHFVHGFLENVEGIDFARQGRDGHPRQSLQGDGADRHRRIAAARAACTRWKRRPPARTPSAS